VGGDELVYTEPFTVEVPDAVLRDLDGRLSRTRWPDVFAGRGWADGTDVDYLTELVSRWRGDFDWRAQERRINAFPHYRADLDGQRLHFVHVRGRGPEPMPLVLTHGWPSSFLEYLPIVPLLTDPAANGADPADSFDLVIPSLPGYAFSAALPRGASSRIPALWVQLMTEVLGYERFGAYGGDIGGMVTNRLALEFPERLLGIMTSYVAEPYFGPGSAAPTAAEREILERRRSEALSGGNAYWHVQSTRPQTLAVGLTDSPAGLAAWLIDKWREWVDCEGDLERRFSKDELLALLTLYWTTGTIGSSFQIYADWQLGHIGRNGARNEDSHVPSGVGKPLEPTEKIEVPAAIVLFALAQWPREWAERAYADLRVFKTMPRGGHFGALEEPELLSDEIRTFFSGLR
jgi:pimeloyl-ACP methyl ester carboxylesterase